jgi:hypothetical protein
METSRSVAVCSGIEPRRYRGDLAIARNPLDNWYYQCGTTISRARSPYESNELRLDFRVFHPSRRVKLFGMPETLSFVGFKLPRPMRDALCERAAAETRSRSAVIRDALAEYLELDTPESEEPAAKAGPTQIQLLPGQGALRNGHFKRSSG